MQKGAALLRAHPVGAIDRNNRLEILIGLRLQTLQRSFNVIRRLINWQSNGNARLRQTFISPVETEGALPVIRLAA